MTQQITIRQAVAESCFTLSDYLNVEQYGHTTSKYDGASSHTLLRLNGAVLYQRDNLPTGHHVDAAMFG